MTTVLLAVTFVAWWRSPLRDHRPAPGATPAGPFLSRRIDRGRDERSHREGAARIEALCDRIRGTIRYTEADLIRGRTVSNPAEVLPLTHEALARMCEAIRSADQAELEGPFWLILEHAGEKVISLAALMGAFEGEGALKNALRSLVKALESGSEDPSRRGAARVLGSWIERHSSPGFQDRGRHARVLLEFVEMLEIELTYSLPPAWLLVERMRFLNEAADSIDRSSPDYIGRFGVGPAPESMATRAQILDATRELIERLPSWDDSHIRLERAVKVALENIAVLSRGAPGVAAEAIGLGERLCREADPDRLAGPWRHAVEIHVRSITRRAAELTLPAGTMDEIRRRWEGSEG